MKRIFKNNIKVIVAFIVGIILSGSIVYGVNVASSSVSYSNSKSNTGVTTVAGALNELYTKSATTNMCMITQAGEYNWYGMYVCDGEVGTLKACFYGDPVNGGRYCSGTSYTNYKPIIGPCNNNSDIYTSQDWCGGGEAFYVPSGGMPYTISCSC